jgi:hypothetical protein
VVSWVTLAAPAATGTRLSAISPAGTSQSERDRRVVEEVMGFIVAAPLRGIIGAEAGGAPA